MPPTMAGAECSMLSSRPIRTLEWYVSYVVLKGGAAVPSMLVEAFIHLLSIFGNCTSDQAPDSDVFAQLFKASVVQPHPVVFVYNGLTGKWWPVYDGIFYNSDHKQHICLYMPSN